MTKQRAMELLDSEVKRHLALARAASEAAIFAAHMEVADALMLAIYCLREVVP